MLLLLKKISDTIDFQCHRSKVKVIAELIFFQPKPSLWTLQNQHVSMDFIHLSSLQNMVFQVSDSGSREPLVYIFLQFYNLNVKLLYFAIHHSQFGFRHQSLLSAILGFNSFIRYFVFGFSKLNKNYISLVFVIMSLFRGKEIY